MFAYIKGELTQNNPTAIVLETGGIGYEINVSLTTYSSLPSKGTVKLFIHLSIKEDAHTLYGFSTESEREIFRKLISVSGVGTNTARMILSSLTPSEVMRAIQSGNVAALKNVKGIGPKTAQRVIVDLRDKMGDSITDVPGFEGANNTPGNEALSALVSLGFDKKKAGKALDEIIAKENTSDVEELIKLALKKL